MDPYKKPGYRIEVDGTDLTATIKGRLNSLTLTDNRGDEADQLDIVLDDGDGKLDLPPRGAVIRIAFGWEGSGLVDKGSYTVDGVRHSGAPDILTIRARSADLRAGLTTQRERSWHAASVGDIVKTIADENDLLHVVSAKLSAIVMDHIDQTNESSINFLTRLAALHDAIVTVKNGKLLFMHKGAGTSASGKPLPGVTIDRQSGDSHNFEVADRDAYTAVKATYNDTADGTKGEVYWSKIEDDAENNRAVQAAAVPAGQYLAITKVSKSHAAAKRLAHKEWKRISKLKAMRDKYIGVKAPYNDRNLGVSGEVPYGAADEQKARQNASRTAQKDAARLGKPSVAIDHSADNTLTLRHVYSSLANARHAARAKWRMLQRGMAEFSITLAHGQPELIPEMPATVSGFKPAIDSTDWIVTKATHTLNDSGYTTQLEMEIKATEVPG